MLPQDRVVDDVAMKDLTPLSLDPFVSLVSLWCLFGGNEIVN